MTTVERVPARRIRTLGNIVPDVLETDVTFTTFFNIKNAANYYYCYPFHTNAPYDADPALGSTATVGHAEMTALYSKCRALSYTVDAECYNIGSYPTIVTMINRNSILSTAGGSAVDTRPYIGNPLVHHAVLGHATGPARHRFKFSYNLRQITGTDEVLIDDTYASSTTSTPSNLTYLEIGAISDPSAPTYLTQGITTLLTLTYRVRYFERKQFTS